MRTSANKREKVSSFEEGTFFCKSLIAVPKPYYPAFAATAKAILGPSYTLSLVICGDTLARRINKESRNKTYSPNVLSFPFDKKEGEIFLNIRKAEREAKGLGIPTKERIALLFVHGCLHLKGYDHSDAMERQEDKLVNVFLAHTSA